MGGRSRLRSLMTASMSESAGRAPRSRSASTWTVTLLVLAPICRRRKAWRLRSSSRAVMPKSSRATVPSACTIMFPPCRSPWKTPYRRAPSRNAMRLERRTAAVSMPASRMPSASLHGNPCRCSITRTRRVTSSGWGRGTTTVRWPVTAKTPAMSSMFWASRRKSSSSTMVSANSSTRAGGLVRAVTGMRPTRNGAIQAMAAMSSRTMGATRLRCTLTTTRSPVRRVAAWTWAMEAEAMGVRSNEVNTSARGRPRSSSTVRRTTVNASGGTRSRSSRNSETSSSGKMPSPEELVSEFRLLRDRVPPEAFTVVRRTVEEDLGRPLAEVFTSFDRTPIASASIAQVHAATLRTGERVVVKVQRSRVAPMVRLDIAAMAWIAPFLVGRIPVAALSNPPALVELFAETIVEELDFRLEAQNMLDIAGVFAETGQRTVVVPRPHPELVTRRVLVMEHLHGFPWSDAEDMREAGIDTAAVLRSSLIAFLEGALLYGVFHGDLHGGNMIVQPDGTVALLDFGITARLDERKRQAFLRLQMGASTNNVTVQVEALRDLGALPADSDIEAVIRDLNLDRPPIDPTTLTADEMMAELRDVTKALLAYGARLPKELMLFVKNMLFLNGAMAAMAPDVDILGEIMAVVSYFTEHHGERIAREVGFEVTSDTIDLDGYRAAMGFTEEADAITFRDLEDRRELIAKRLEAHQRPRRRVPLLRALYRVLRPARD